MNNIDNIYKQYITPNSTYGTKVDKKIVLTKIKAFFFDEVILIKVRDEM